MVSVERKPDQPRSTDRILNKALDLFSQKGYDATSVREICEAAEVTKPTLYHFFGSKEGVYRALVDEALLAFREVLMRELGTAGTTEARLRRFARAYLTSARQEPELARFVLRLAHSPLRSAPSTDFRMFHDVIAAQVERVVEQGVASGELAPGAGATRRLVLLGSLGQALRAYLFLGGADLDESLADALVDTVISGWRQRPSPERG